MAEQETLAEEEQVDEPQPPTVEELQKELASAKENSTKFESNWKDAQRVSSKKDTENQRLREQLTGNESQSDMIKALIAMMAQQKNQPAEEFAEEVETRQPDLLKQYEEITKRAEQKRLLDGARVRVKGIQDRTEELGVKGEEYKVIRALARNGQYEEAEFMLTKVASAPKEPTKPKETEDERVERKTAEKLKAELKERGLLTQDTGKPSASTKTRKAKIEAYAKGEITRGEYEKALS